MPPALPEPAACRTCLVTGATGAIGPAVVAALIGAGHRVRALVHQAPPAGLFAGDVELRTGDVADVRAMSDAMDGVDWVFHLAARLHVVNPPPSMRAEYERVNVEGTRVVANAAAAAGASRVVFFSTVAVYGSSRGATLTEATVPRPDTIYGDTKLAAERAVAAARDAAGRSIGTVLRLAAVYGPRVKGNYRRLLVALARRRFVPIGPGRNRRTLVFEIDAARAAVAAASHPRAAGAVFNVTDGAVHEVREIVEAICDAIGRRPPVLSLPVTAARAAAWAVDRVRRDRRESAQAALDKYLEDVAVDGSKLRDELGYLPACDLREGWRRTVQTMREQGAL